MMNPRLYTTSYNKSQGQQFDTAVPSFIKLQYTEKSCKMINIFVLVTILGHLPVILSAKSKESEDMKQILIVEVGPSLGPQLMAEIGDVLRFTYKGAITAFAGVDPGVNESGTYEQKSVPTSKRGSSALRKTLFQIMDALIKTKPQDNPVYQFLDKKRAQGKPYYVYMTAGANKFLRIYYGRVKEYLASLPES